MSKPSPPKPVRIGIIGGGLMGREMASAFARWCAIDEPGLPAPVLTAVADLNPDTLAWFDRIPSAKLLTADYHELLASPDVDVVYVAVPHHLHLVIYADVLKAKKDLFAEKPFGIDLEAARAIASQASSSGQFVRCSSEFPFLPAVQVIHSQARSGQLGRILEVNAGFHHSSDLDPDKAANWKRLSKFCGNIGVMGDLGMHVLHLPLRLGWNPTSVYAQLQKGYPQRPDGKGGMADCDTWDNATLHTWTTIDANDVPMRLEMKRLAPGATNSWWFEIIGTKGGFRYSSAEPKSLFSFSPDTPFGQSWARTDLGFGTAFKTVTGGIFEPGFPDIIQQMWAAFLAERAGMLNERFGCVTPAEAVRSHELFLAALNSQSSLSVIQL